MVFGRVIEGIDKLSKATQCLLLAPTGSLKCLPVQLESMGTKGGTPLFEAAEVLKTLCRVHGVPLLGRPSSATAGSWSPRHFARGSAKQKRRAVDEPRSLWDERARLDTDTSSSWLEEEGVPLEGGDPPLVLTSSQGARSLPKLCLQADFNPLAPTETCRSFGSRRGCPWK